MRHSDFKRLGTFLFILFILFQIQACQRDALPSENLNEGSDCVVTEKYVMPKISADIVDLTENDAVAVANIFSKSMAETKSSYGTLPVKDVVTIKGGDGEPVIYAVNYLDGYILVSATKKYHPILAEVEHGSFSLNAGTGQDVLLRDYINDIECAKKNINSELEKKAWCIYEEPVRLNSVKTKVAKDDYYDMLDPYLLEWYRDGRKVYYMRNKPENMPEDLYELFCTIARDDMPEIPGYSYLDCAIITEKEYDYRSNYGPFLQTQWGQRSPFNSSLGNVDQPLGCVTIATGQIMRFHEYPTSYAWNSMPSTTSNTTLSNFLKKLHDDLKVSDAGGASISDAERVFKRYGYNCKKINHKVSEVNGSLIKKNPVYMRGIHQETNEGHAWVCDGSKSFQPRTEYRMYELLFSNNKPYMMDEFAQEIIYGDIYTMYHMNWGWEGLNDGYFYDNHIKVPLNGTHYNFSSSRQDLIISK